jgi:hypothetical protein
VAGQGIQLEVYELEVLIEEDYIWRNNTIVTEGRLGGNWLGCHHDAAKTVGIGGRCNVLLDLAWQGDILQRLRCCRRRGTDVNELIDNLDLVENVEHLLKELAEDHDVIEPFAEGLIVKKDVIDFE